MRKTDGFLKGIPSVEAAHMGGKQRPTAIVLRSSWTTSDKGAAFGIAQTWQNPRTRRDSCHYVVDDAQTIRCVPDDRQAIYLGNSSHKGVISVNVCYDPPDLPTEAVMSRTVALVAHICARYRIPVRVLTDDQHKSWFEHKWRRRGGIILKTPATFPVEDFLERVRHNYGI